MNSLTMHSVHMYFSYSLMHSLHFPLMNFDATPHAGMRLTPSILRARPDRSTTWMSSEWSFATTF
jgi:hypothetical protein